MKRINQQTISKFLNKRVLTALGLCLLLGAAVLTNVLLEKKPDTEQVVQTEDPTNEAVEVSAMQSGSINFFDAYREERENVRTQELAYLDAIVAQGADEETLSDAQSQRLDLIDCMEMELTVENLVKAKGFTEAIVSMHRGSVNVIVGADSLSDEQVAQILDIVLRETGEKAENIKISTAP